MMFLRKNRMKFYELERILIKQIKETKQIGKNFEKGVLSHQIKSPGRCFSNKEKDSKKTCHIAADRCKFIP